MSILDWIFYILLPPYLWFWIGIIGATILLKTDILRKDFTPFLERSGYQWSTFSRDDDPRLWFSIHGASFALGILGPLVFIKPLRQKMIGRILREPKTR